MTKRDLVVRIAAESGLIQSQVADIVQKTLDYIADELADGHTVELRNFGIFDVVTRKARPGRNPAKPNVSVAIPEHRAVKFRAGKELKDRVANTENQKL